MINDNQPQGDHPTSHLDPRRKKILFRCWHRGMKEMDLLLGGYVQAKIGDLDEAQLSALEELMELHDQDLYSWFIGSKPVPSAQDTELFRDILAFYQTQR